MTNASDENLNSESKSKAKSRLPILLFLVGVAVGVLAVILGSLGWKGWPSYLLLGVATACAVLSKYLSYMENASPD